MADFIEIQLEIDGQPAFAKIQRQATKAGTRAGDNFGSNFSDAASVAAGAFVANIAVDAINSLRSALAGSIQTAAAFGRGIAEINSILPSNAKLTEQATKQLQEFAIQFGSNQQAQAKAFYNIVSAGVQGTSKQLEVLETANAAAVAGLVDIDTAAFALVSSVNAYSKSGLTATEASDSLFAAVKAGQTTLGELANSIGRVTSLASGAGVSFQDLSGTVAFLTKSGIATAEAVTGLRAIISSVIKPSSEAANIAQRLGLEFNSAALRAKGLAGFLNDVIVATGGSQDQLAKLFGSVEALSGVQAIAGNFKEFSGILGDVTNSAGATQTALKTLTETDAFKIDQLAASFENLSSKIGEAGLGLANDLIPQFGKLFQELDTLVTGAAPAQRSIEDINSEITKLANILAGDERTEDGGFVGDILNFLSGDKPKRSQRELDAINERLQRLIKQRDELRRQDVEAASRAPIGELQQIEENGPLDSPSSQIAETAAQVETQIAESVENSKASLGELREIEKQIAQERGDELIQFGDLFSDFSSQFKSQAAIIAQTSSQLASTVSKNLINGIGNAAGSAFAAFGRALATGENAFKAFAQAFLSTIGQVAIQQGTSFILQGIAYQFLPGFQAVGSSLIAAGAALAVFGGALTAVGGGGAGAGAGGGAQLTDPTRGFQDSTDFANDEERELNRQVALTVNGNIFSNDETRQEVVKLINDAFEEDGTVLIGGNGAQFA